MRKDFWLKEREELRNLIKNPSLKMKSMFG
jgi:hypothetical protein